MKLYCKTTITNPETESTRTDFRPTTEPEKLWDMINEDKNTLINFALDLINSEMTNKIDENDLLIEEDHFLIEVWAPVFNRDSLLFSVKIVDESQMNLDEIKLSLTH